jgi:hypothetical protein
MTFQTHGWILSFGPARRLTRAGGPGPFRELNSPRHYDIPPG